MPLVRIRLFGRLQVLSREGVPLLFPTRKAELLFAFLVLHRGRAYPREVLAGLLWGDRTEDAARKALRTALWRVRSVLEPDGVPRGTFLLVEGPTVRFPAEAPAWVDVQEFQLRTAFLRGATGELGDEEVQGLQEALALYRGDLLDGIYDDWCLMERERLRLSLLRAREELMLQYERDGEWEAAVGEGREILRTDPLREHIHRDLMRCLVGLGDRPSALRQYQSCRTLLGQELEVEPMPETEALYREILSGGEFLSRLGLPAALVSGDTDGMIHKVEDVLEELYAVASRLERARLTLRGAGTRPRRSRGRVTPG